MSNEIYQAPKVDLANEARNAKGPFEPMKEIEDKDLDEDGNESQSFENGFRGVFRGFDDLEEMIRTCRYPRIMVQPIAIYRAIKPNKALQRSSC